MPSDWERTTLGELIARGLASLQTGPFGTVLKASEYSDEGVPLISVREIRHGFLQIGSSTPRVREATVKRLPAYVLREGDVVFGRKGGVDRNSLISKSQEGWFLGSDGIRLRLSPKLDSAFISYQLRSDHIQGWLLHHSEGTTMASLNQQILGRLPLIIPEISVQMGISELLGSLDAKITALADSSTTLEAIAEAIFKSWFVDFDPVRAKAEGREPEGIDAATAVLFPSEFADSPLGPVPWGWSIDLVGDLSRRVSMGPFGSDIKTDNFISEGVPIIRGKNLGHGFIDDDFVYISDEKADELRNANAFGGDIVITHRGTLGQVGLIPRHSRYPRYVVSQSQMVVSVRSDKATPTFLYYYLISRAGKHQLLANTSQTGVPAISRPTTSVKAIRLPVPDRIEILQAFESLVSMLMDRVNVNAGLCRTLVGLRDSLLPRLISGKLRIPEAATLAEAVV
jgi:type I restriction enzyme, S subunit